VRYTWQIECFHQETHHRTVTDSEGHSHSETFSVNVVTHTATTHGNLYATDASPVFQPDTRKASLGLSSRLDITIDDAFRTAYAAKREAFYAQNRCDLSHRETDTFSLPPMKDKVRAQWVDAPEPWYAKIGSVYFAMMTCRSACWLAGIDGYMALQTVVFKKTCTGFADEIVATVVVRPAIVATVVQQGGDGACALPAAGAGGIEMTANPVRAGEM